MEVCEQFFNRILFFVLKVESVFAVPIVDLLNRSNQKYTTFRSGLTMPVFLNRYRVIWGATGLYTGAFLQAAFPELYTVPFRRIENIERSRF